jgi:hypothetical protein
MTPEKAALLGVLAGGLITLVGTLFTGGLNMWLQWLQTRWQLKNESKTRLLEKRLVALQNCVQMVDFLIAAKNASLAKGGQDMWVAIRKENISNGAFFPAELQDEFAKTIRTVLMHDHLTDSEREFDFQLLERLREGCVKHIQEEFGA